MPHDNVASLNLEREDVGHDTNSEPRRHPRREITTLGRGSENGGAVSAGPDSLRCSSRPDLGAVVRERCVFDDDDDIRTVLRQLRRFAGNSRRAEHKCVNLTAPSLVGQHTRGSHCLESYFAYFCAASFHKSKYVGHQRTLASVCNSFTNSGTAAAPSPTIRPAFLSGGSSIRITVNCGCGSCA